MVSGASRGIGRAVADRLEAAGYAVSAGLRDPTQATNSGTRHAIRYDATEAGAAESWVAGTIRMHQERDYPGRVSATQLRNPDFAAYAVAFGGHGECVERTEEFAPAFERALASGKPAILHCRLDPRAQSVGRDYAPAGSSP